MTDIGGRWSISTAIPARSTCLNFHFRPDQINLPRSAAPAGRDATRQPSGLASSYMVNPQQVSGPTVSAERFCHGRNRGLNLSGLERVMGAAQQYQMGPYQAVSALPADFRVKRPGMWPRRWVLNLDRPGHRSQFAGPIPSRCSTRKQNMTADYAAQQVAQHSQAARRALSGGRGAVQDAEASAI
jgi:hypothetical protein